jgi:hypothetical protein
LVTTAVQKSGTFDSDVLNEKRVQKYDKSSNYKTLNGRERFSIPPVSFGVIIVPVPWLM